jgi:hypothetical protein
MGNTMLTLGHDPAITASFLDQLEAQRPGAYSAFSAHTLDEFRTLAFLHKETIGLVVLGAAQTDEEAGRAQDVVDGIWGEGKMRLLRLPGSLLTEEGKNGGMLQWFLKEFED